MSLFADTLVGEEDSLTKTGSNKTENPSDSMLSKVSGRKKIGELLVEMGFIGASDLDEYVRRAQHAKVLLGQFLVSEGVLSDVDLAQALAVQMSLEFRDLSKQVILTEVLTSIPENIIRQYRVLPVARENGALIIASDDPRQSLATEELVSTIPAPFKICLSPRSQIEKAIDRFFGTQRKTIEKLAVALSKSPEGPTQGSGSSHAVNFGQPTIDSLLEKMFEMALRNGSSDIHLDPADGFLRIRERIDG
ncbi:MAG: hypothetical protein KGQ59_00835, partial [Bdellovibrionales bacterium]|nr:hypothetical protein [Bdellovibrionales bacterium]